MRINTTRTNTLRHAYRWRSLLDIALHPLLMPTYVVITFFHHLFPYTVHNRNTMLLITLYFVATCLAPLMISFSAIVRSKHYDMWRPKSRESSIIVILITLVFYATSLLFYRSFYFLSFMSAPVIIGMALIMIRLFTISRTSIDMHMAALSAALTYIYCLSFQLATTLSTSSYMLLALGGLLAYSSIETRQATPRSLLYGLLAGFATSLTCFIIFK